MIRYLLVLIIAAAACKPKPEATPTEPTETATQGEQLSEPGTTPVNVPPADGPMVMNEKLSDELKLYCARAKIDAETSGTAKPLDAETLGTEGASAEAVVVDGAIVRIHGGKLFESQRESFDYVFRDGKLVCAHETRSSIHVILDEEEGWELWWHQQHLVFNKGAGLVSISADYTTKGKDRGADPERVHASAQELFALAGK